MGMSKEEFVEKMMRNEFGKKRSSLNKAIREGRLKECNGDALEVRKSGRIRATKQMPNSKHKKF